MVINQNSNDQISRETADSKKRSLCCNFTCFSYSLVSYPHSTNYFQSLDFQIWQSIFWWFLTRNLEKSILRGAEQLLSLLIQLTMRFLFPFPRCSSGEWPLSNLDINESSLPHSWTELSWFSLNFSMNLSLAVPVW